MISKNNLHSNMVIFKRCIDCMRRCQYGKFTFQSGDIQMDEGLTTDATFTFIYIPIWWYSNLILEDCKIDYHCEFTFQSGDIQIFTFSITSSSPICFTFQSGDIQIFKGCGIYFFYYSFYIPIWWYSNCTDALWWNCGKLFYIPIWWYSNLSITIHLKLIFQNLHSNLVIFKSDVHHCTGSHVGNLHSNLVIFKSKISSCSNATERRIYIPIWWYSNFGVYYRNATTKTIYIPIWWYSNIENNKNYLTSNFIYIPIWWYSNCKERLQDYNKFCRFTFQSGDIQMWKLWNTE